jgi:hypothetical protein
MPLPAESQVPNGRNTSTPLGVPVVTPSLQPLQGATATPPRCPHLHTGATALTAACCTAHGWSLDPAASHCPLRPSLVPPQHHYSPPALSPEGPPAHAAFTAAVSADHPPPPAPLLVPARPHPKCSAFMPPPAWGACTTGLPAPHRHAPLHPAPPIPGPPLLITQAITSPAA